MITIINKLDNIDLLFDKGQFNIEEWTLYINNIYENSDYIFKQELNEYTKNNKGLLGMNNMLKDYDI